ncbi:hypothetical protein BH10BAC1_BH10BAC1_17100 [soil metagenome]
MTRKQTYISFFILFALCIFLTFNKHSKDKKETYHGVIWADAAGYYVYNPMWFIYGNNAAAFPNSIIEKTGNGFKFDETNNKVITKSPCGVAILQAPFFFASHCLAEPLGYNADGFSRIYSLGLFISGVFYCCLGLFFLSTFLSRHFSKSISIIAPLLFLAGTNLFYYSIDAPSMSHVYSFFLFSVILYLTPKITAKVDLKEYLLFYACVVLAVMARPTNILILLFPLFYMINSKKELIERMKFFFKNKVTIAIALLTCCLIAIPQLLYWHSTTGKFISYSYGTETFHFLKPHLLETWFSTNNGLFTYSPLLLLSVIGIVLLIKHKNWSGYLYAGLFLLTSYVFASWWNWWFGCSFGARSFVEYYTVLIIPFCYLMEQSMKNRYSRIAFFLAVGFCCYLNLDMEYYYDGCFYGGAWDFTTYLKLLNS